MCSLCFFSLDSAMKNQFGTNLFTVVLNLLVIIFQARQESNAAAMFTFQTSEMRPASHI